MLFLETEIVKVINQNFFFKVTFQFLDPIGSLVSTLLVSGLLLLVMSHIFKRGPHHKNRSTTQWCYRAETSQIEHNLVLLEKNGKKIFFDYQV